MAWHNTGCLWIYNFTNEDFAAQDLEEPSLNIYIQATSEQTWGGTIFPWCANATEIRDKAFLFRRLPRSTNEFMFYMFQKWPADDTIHWARYAGGNPNFEAATYAGAQRSSNVNVFIESIAGDVQPRAEPA
jgi:hypothetical protein